MSRDVLLVGLPRSGTSWVGSVLGSSPSVEYVREPITQSWLGADHKTPLVDPAADPGYRDHCAKLLQRDGRRRLIKEVNPLLVPYALEQHPVQVVLLHRHPCAVALSYHERGWTRLDTEQRFGVPSSNDFWQDHGVYQALLLEPAAAAIAGRGEVVAYEDLTRRPGRAFAALAAALDLVWGEKSSHYLETTLTEGDRNDPYALRRDAAAARDRWMTALTEDQQEAVLAGYMSHRSENLPLP